MKLNSLAEMSLYLHARHHQLYQKILADNDLDSLVRFDEIEDLISKINLENKE